MNRKLAFVCAVALLATAACATDGNDLDDVLGDAPDGCTTVPIATSPEKLDLLTSLAKSFNNGDDNEVDGTCSFVQIAKVSSGVGASLLAEGWPDEQENGTRPVVWSPSASSWGAVVNERLAQKQQPPVVPTDAKPFMLTPLVIAMPKPMAEALGYPKTPIGFGDLLALATANDGWASKGHPEWGAFKLGKTNPNFSTSGLSSTIAQYYAATGKQSDLTLEDVNRPNVDTFMRGVESAVVHYGDTTLSFLNNLYRNDRAGLGLTYVSAVAVEETSIIAYNRGNPDGILDPGEQPRAPRVPLVAVYPKDGTLFSDNPFFVLNAPWVSAAEKKAARLFESFVQKPANQKRVLTFGFRPGNPAVAVASPISARFGVDPAQPTAVLGVPEPAVLVRLIEKWGEQRKAARVLLVIDVSGSMGEEVDGGETKLDLAKRASVEALGAVQARRPRRPAHLLHQHFAQGANGLSRPRSARRDFRQPRGDRRAHPQPRADRRHAAVLHRQRLGRVHEAGLRRVAHQRHRPADRRQERGRLHRPQRHAGGATRRLRRPVVEPRPAVHDRLRARRRQGRPEAAGRGDQCGLL